MRDLRARLGDSMMEMQCLGRSRMSGLISHVCVMPKVNSEYMRQAQAMNINKIKILKLNIKDKCS